MFVLSYLLWYYGSVMVLHLSAGSQFLIQKVKVRSKTATITLKQEADILGRDKKPVPLSYLKLGFPWSLDSGPGS